MVHPKRESWELMAFLVMSPRDKSKIGWQKILVKQQAKQAKVIFVSLHFLGAETRFKSWERLSSIGHLKAVVSVTWIQGNATFFACWLVQWETLLFWHISGQPASKLAISLSRWLECMAFDQSISWFHEKVRSIFIALYFNQSAACANLCPSPCTCSSHGMTVNSIFTDSAVY